MGKSRKTHNASKANQHAGSRVGNLTGLRGSNLTNERISIAATAFFLLSLIIITCCQGGFYSPVLNYFGICGAVVLLVLSAMAAKSRRSINFPAPFICLAAVGLCAIVSALTNNALSYTSIQTACRWFSLAAIAAVLIFVDRQITSKACDAFAWCGTALSVTGILMASGALDVYGAMNAGRLQFVFQYANSAGLWFLVVALVCASSRSATLQKLQAIPTAAVVLTQSAGSLILLFAGAATYAAILIKTSPDANMAQPLRLISGFFLGLMAGACALVFGYVWSVLAVAIAVAATFAIDRPLINLHFSKRRCAAIAAVTFIIILIAAIAIAIVFLPDRLTQASQTLIERFIQISDALAIIAQSPIFGIGPNRWDAVYPLFQSAQYQTSYVHCGFLQIYLEAGLIGLVFFVAFLAIGIKGLARRRAWLQLIIAYLMLVHIALDIDIQFSAIVLLLAFVLYGEGDLHLPATANTCAVANGSNHVSIDTGRAIHMAAALLIAATGIIGSIVGIYTQSTLDAADAYALTNNTDELDSLANSSLGRRDTNIQNLYLQALYNAGNHETVIAALTGAENTRATDLDNATNYKQDLLYFRSLIALGDADQASEFLASKIKTQPYNRFLLEEVCASSEIQAMNNEQRSKIEQALDFANDQTQENNARLLNNQKQWMLK